MISCCVGGFVLSLRIVGTSPAQRSITNTAISQEHPTEKIILEPINSQTFEYTATISNSFRPIVITDTPSSEKTLTLTPLRPPATLTLVPTITTSPLVVHFIDVGQGDSILIVSPEGKTVLIDGGSTNTGVVDYLQMQGIHHIDIMIATHPHEDHIGGLIQVLETMPVLKVITNGEMHTTVTYENFLDAIAASKAEYLEVVRGDTINLGNLTFNVLNPAFIVPGDLNRNSIVLRMTYGNTTFLFAGDSNNDTEAEMIAAGLSLKADILKVGHHGSSTSTSAEFLAAVHPAVAVYSAGNGNSYGHPSPDTLARLGYAGVNVLGTDINGTVVFLVDGTGYSIQTSKQVMAQTPIVTPENSSISVVSLTSPISLGATAQLIIRTSPGAACSITVYYKSGASQADGLGPQVADASGQAIWKWKVGSSTTPGIWSIVVNAIIGGKTATLSIPFEVR